MMNFLKLYSQVGSSNAFAILCQTLITSGFRPACWTRPAPTTEARAIADFCS